MKGPKIIKDAIKSIVERCQGAGHPLEGHIKTVEFHKDVAVIRLSGRIVFDTFKAVRDEFVSKTKEEFIKKILFDLKGVTEVDSSGVAALIELSKYMKAHQRGVKIGLVNLTPKMRDLLEISKTKKLFKEYSSEGRAISALAKRTKRGHPVWKNAEGYIRFRKVT